MTQGVPKPVVRVAIVLVAVVIFAVTQQGSHRNPSARASDTHELTPEIRARSFTFAPEVAPADRAWILASIAKARPEAQQLIGAVDGLVTIRTVDMPGTPWVGEAQEGTDDVTLNTAYLDGERKADRDQALLHELGHVVDFELVPDDAMEQMASEIPQSGVCVVPETGDCTAPQERFADTFAKWALNGAVSRVGAGYGVQSPASLETWGEPLGLIAAKLRVSAS
jgi:hypothetical protein